jgi:hypothetical protein
MRVEKASPADMLTDSETIKQITSIDNTIPLGNIRLGGWCGNVYKLTTNEGKFLGTVIFVPVITPDRLGA